MSKVAIYVRVSTKNTQDYNYQINYLKQLILPKGYSEDDIDVYGESISGYKKLDERPELERLILKTEENNKYYDCIYTTEISRVGRKPSETRKIIDRWAEIKQQVFIPKIGNILDDEGKQSMLTSIILQILIEYSNLEAETFKTRSKMGLHESAIKGGAGGGVYQPYGFKNENKKLVVETKEIEIIKEIFKLYSEGLGSKVISNLLNERNIPTRTQIAFNDCDKEINFKNRKNINLIKWSDKQILDILANTIYKGDRRFKGEIIKLDESIISDELFDKCTEIRMGKSHRNYLTTYQYLLKDIIVCSICGRNYFAKYKPVKGGDKVYICSSRLVKNGNCGNLGINISLVESILFYEILDTPSLLPYINNVEEITDELITQQKNLEFQINNENKCINDLNQQKNRILTALLNGHLDSEIYYLTCNNLDKQIYNSNVKIRSHNKGLNSIKSALKKIKNDNTSFDKLYDSKNNRHELRILFKQFINKVYVNKLDERLILLTVEVCINGVKLKNTMKFIIDIMGLRKKVPEYKFISFYKMCNDPCFKKNIAIN